MHNEQHAKYGAPTLKNKLVDSKQMIGLLLVAFAFYLISFFVSSTKFMAILHISSFMALAAMGQTLVFLIAGIDLSVASLLSAAGILLCYFVDANIPFALCILLVIAASAVIGVINGLGISCLHIPPLVMTVAMQYILRGATLVTTNGKPIAITTDQLSNWVNQGVIGGLSGGILVMAVCGAVLMWMLYKAKFGREIFFLGSSPRVAVMSGISTVKVTVLVYTIAAAMTGLTGIMLVGYTGTAAVRIGDSYLLPSIAAVLLGGTSPLGGKGNVVRTMIGAFILCNTVSLLTVMQMTEATRQVIEGFIVLIFIVVNNSDLQSRKKRKTA